MNDPLYCHQLAPLLLIINHMTDAQFYWIQFSHWVPMMISLKQRNLSAVYLRLKYHFHSRTFLNYWILGDINFYYSHPCRMLFSWLLWTFFQVIYLFVRKEVRWNPEKTMSWKDLGNPEETVSPRRNILANYFAFVQVWFTRSKTGLGI